MAFRINKQGAWERYGLILWFDRFDRFGRTGLASVCFLTFFISLMVAAPFIYYARECLSSPTPWLFWYCKTCCGCSFAAHCGC